MLLIFVMQDQDKSEKPIIKFHSVAHTNTKPCAAINAQSVQRNKLMIVRSYSMNRDKSQTTNSFFRRGRDKHSNSSRHETITKDHIQELQKFAKKKESNASRISNSQISNCAQELRKFRNLQKQSLFNRISNLEHKINRQIRHSKNRENRKNIVKSKINKMHFNNNSINFNDIKSLITITNIRHVDKSNKSHQDNKIRPPTSINSFSKFSAFQQRILRESHSKSICLSKSLQLKKQLWIDNSFSAWNTQQDYDF